MVALDGLGDDTLMRAIAALERCGQQLARHDALVPVMLSLEGLDGFGTRVLFFKVASEPPDHVHQLARAARTAISGVGRAHDRRAFRPHATVMKTSKMQEGDAGDGILPAMYQACADTRVGPLRVNSMQLCCMQRPPGAAAYAVVASLCLEVGEVTVGAPWAQRFGAWRERQCSNL